MSYSLPSSMMRPSNGNIFRVTSPLCGEFTGHRWIPLTKASDVELWCFSLICAWINSSVKKWNRWFETLSRPLWHCNSSFKNEGKYPYSQCRLRTVLFRGKIFMPPIDFLGFHRFLADFGPLLFLSSKETNIVYDSTFSTISFLIKRQLTHIRNYTFDFAASVCAGRHISIKSYFGEGIIGFGPSFKTIFTVDSMIYQPMSRRAILSWVPRWRQQMETFSALLALCAGNSPVTGEFPAQKPVTWSFDVFFDLRLNHRLSKQP